ncbi:hypothetical protein MYE70_00600 [Marinobacter alexandrii]|uniref:hypothetical protein n=1 Tax=Marinobacter alexandrii TaxID=2570351 RepID=UPI001FFF2159|nr:hypothetical protein [Marinobacter alexandrii]MCK2147556.1 hypothetical protein [Marinobacter alexandrii]
MKKQEYRRLRWLDSWLTAAQSARGRLPAPELFDIYQQLKPDLEKVNEEHPLFMQPHLGHPFYAAFESQKQGGGANRRLSQLRIRTVDQALRTRTTRLTRWRPPSVSNALVRPEYEPPERLLEVLIGVALRRILRWQQAAIGVQHRFTWYATHVVRAEQLAEGALPCVLCLAFSLWCHAIVRKLLSPWGMDGAEEHKLCQFAGYNEFPHLPLGVYVKRPRPLRIHPKYARERFYRPSATFERWLFLRSSDIAFSECLDLAQWLLSQTADKQMTTPESDCSLHDRFNRAIHPSEILELIRRDNKLQATFWPATPLADFTLSEADVKKVRRCPNFLWGGCSRLWQVEPDPGLVNRKTIRDLMTVIEVNRSLGRFHNPSNRVRYSLPLHRDGMLVLKTGE